MDAKVPTDKSLPEKERVAKDGQKELDAIEAGFDRLLVVLNRGFKLGMISKVERGKYASWAKKLKAETEMMHSELTGVAQRNGADGALSRGGPGR